MKDDVQDQRRVFGWALPGSLAAHALVALLLIFGLPLPFFEAEAEKAIEVDLVPPKPPEKPKAEPPPPQEKPEKPEGKKGEKPPEGNDAARPATQPVLKPVFQFGEKDAGPRQAPDGNSAEDGSASPEPERKPDKQELAQPPARAATESKTLIHSPWHKRRRRRSRHRQAKSKRLRSPRRRRGCSRSRRPVMCSL